MCKKKNNYDDFKLTSNLIKHKEHLTPEGLEKIQNIKSSMNSSRLDVEVIGENDL